MRTRYICFKTNLGFLVVKDVEDSIHISFTLDPLKASETLSLKAWTTLLNHHQISDTVILSIPPV